MMMIHPNFNPIALKIGPLAVHWYAVSYLIAFALFLWLGRRRIKQGISILNTEQLDDLLTYGILGVLLGGRLGYVLFYQPGKYFAHPFDIIKVWEGGMSFHGGLIGVLLALWLYARKNGFTFSALLDTTAPLMPLGLASGRIGNFINGELWGRITNPDAWWATGFQRAHYDDMAALPGLSSQMQAVFAQYGMLPRHPSQLYECFFEGIVLFVILWIFSKKKHPLGQVGALGLATYGVFRFCIEFTRQPDDYLGLLSLGLSMGQWLSLPMIVLGTAWFIWAGRKKQTSNK